MSAPLSDSMQPDQPSAQPYLSFSLGARQYGISTEYLEEIFLLPEVTLLSTASPDIIGILNFRGDILPILDPQISLGLTERRPYQPADSIIVLRQDQLRIGLIVGKIGDVENVSVAATNTTAAKIDAQHANAQRPAMIAGLLQSELSSNTLDSTSTPEHTLQTSRWLLTNPAQWLKYVDVQPLAAMQSLMTEKASGNVALNNEGAPGYAVFCPEATPEDRAIFQQRAQSLQQTIESDRTSDVTTLAIVTIEDRKVGVDLLAVKEFAELNTITPIPCCPSHIVGNMNLRGEVLTLVDLQPLIFSTSTLGNNEFTAQHAGQITIQTTSRQSPKLAGFKAMIIDIEDYVVGVLINEVTESLFTLHQRDLVIEQNPETHFQGKFPYKGQSIPVLNLSHLVAQDNFVVDEVV